MALKAAPQRVTPAWISSRAKAFGLDPKAVMSVARTEGLGGGIGDQGRSFGPFQLFYEGAYPSWAPRGSPQASNAWAWSPAGVNYALQGIAKYAKGLTGQQAIDTIIRKFERPADPSANIAKALSFYGGANSALSAVLPALFTGDLIGTPNAKGSTHDPDEGPDNWQSDNAIDIPLTYGTPVRAVADGVISPRFGPLGSGDPRFAGLRLNLIGQDNSYYYAHLSKFAPGIKPGARVKAGQILGYSGTANGVNHLHFGQLYGNPADLYNGTGAVPSADGANLRTLASAGAAAETSKVPFKPGMIWTAPPAAPEQQVPMSGGTIALTNQKAKAAAPNSALEKTLMALLTKKAPAPASYTTSAITRANQDIQAMIAPILAAQQRERDLAAARSAQATQAAAAAAKYMEPWGDRTRDDYAALLGGVGAVSQGYSGELRDITARDTAAAQEMLASIPGNTQQLTDRSADMGNLLLGTTGSLPAQALGAQGAAAIGQARLYPSRERAYGQELSSAALAAGETAAGQYTPALTAAAAQFPTLRNQYQSEMSQAAATAAQNDFDNALAVLKLLQTEKAAAAKTASPFANTKWLPNIGLVGFDKTGKLVNLFPAPSKTTKASKPTLTFGPDGTGYVVSDRGVEAKFGPPAPGEKPTKFLTVGNRIYRVDGQDLVLEATVPKAKAAAKPNELWTDPKGRVWENIPGQGWVLSPKYGTAPKPGAKGLYTPKYWDEKRTQANTLAQSLYEQDEPTQVKNEDGEWEVQPGTGKARTPYRDALQQVIDIGPQPGTKAYRKWVQMASNIVGGIYRIPRTPKAQRSFAANYYRNWSRANGRDEFGNPVSILALAEAIWLAGIPKNIIRQVIPLGLVSNRDLDEITRRDLTVPPKPAAPGQPWDQSKDPLTNVQRGNIAMTESRKWVNWKTKRYVKAP